eukprot:scaffold3263_cov129-Isochrysis_galbana.AAC.6
MASAPSAAADGRNVPKLRGPGAAAAPGHPPLGSAPAAQHGARKAYGGGVEFRHEAPLGSNDAHRLSHEEKRAAEGHA